MRCKDGSEKFLGSSQSGSTSRGKEGRKGEGGMKRRVSKSRTIHVVIPDPKERERRKCKNTGFGIRKYEDEYVCTEYESMVIC